MRSRGIINAQLARVLAELGHTDTLVIADSGLPVPPVGPERVDLALIYGVPSFESVLRAVMDEIVVEGAVAATETTGTNPACWSLLQDVLATDIRRVPHADFKRETERARAVIRTGEATPYANVILRCGVAFA